MSDLISRSELLKRFLVNKDGHRIPERDCDNLEVTISVKDVKTIIKEQTTAYDVDKVVKELRKRKQEYLDGFEIHNNDELYGVVCGLDDAIEIVKQGCVTKNCNNCANYTESDEVDNGCYLCCKGYENNYEPKVDNGGVGKDVE